MPIPIDQQIALLARRCERIVSEAELKAKLEKSAKTGKPLRVKLGMDPTAPDVTLGHCVPLKVVRQFQDLGHKAVLIIGDYTARVGDPTGRNQTRKVLSGDEIDANAKTYVAQVGKILLTDPEHLEVRYNGEWLAKMGLVDIIKLAARKSVAQVLTREDFAKRYAEGVDIRLHEILYPLLQGWDSVMIDADIEMGGSDQLFNNLVGREFQKDEGKDGQCVFVTPLLVGTDGVKKMSKSLGNYVGVTDPPFGTGSMYEKLMGTKADALPQYFHLLTDIDVDSYRSMITADPIKARQLLAYTIVNWLHGETAARAADDYWHNVHREGAVPSDAKRYRIGPGFLRLGVLLRSLGIAKSSSEGFQLVREGAVTVDGKKITDHEAYVFVVQEGSEAAAHQVKPARGDEIVLTTARTLKVGNKRPKFAIIRADLSLAAQGVAEDL